MWAVKHITGLYLYIQYITPAYKRSCVQLRDSGFMCFKTEEEAKQYIEDGKETYYSYDDKNIRLEDLKAVQFIEVKQ